MNQPCLQGEFESKLDNNRRLVLITLPDKEMESDKSATIELEQENNRLQDALEQQNRQIEKLTRDLEGASKKLEEKDTLLEDNRQRQDTIILQLTRQLEQRQRLLEYHQEPWYSLGREKIQKMRGGNSREETIEPRTSKITGKDRRSANGENPSTEKRKGKPMDKVNSSDDSSAIHLDLCVLHNLDNASGDTTTV